MTGSGTVSSIEGDPKLLAELLAGRPLAAAAKSAGMSVSTARRHIGRAAFGERLDEARRGLDALLAATLAEDALVGRAVLRELAEDKDAPPTVRRSAASCLVDLSLSAQARDIATRVERLERERAEAVA